MAMRAIRPRAAGLGAAALLVAAGTASSAVPEGPSSAEIRVDLPESTPEVPAESLDDPVSISPTSKIDAHRVGRASDASTDEIPDVALAAYQRAAMVMRTSDPSCHLEWELLAAIGQMESGHGTANGSQLSDDGVATPGIVGIPLDGSQGRAKIVDSDGGEYDNDARFDRAIGPMQFIPTSWSSVAVDADGDGVRNPQDIDDAALGAAVYLCSGDDDLSTEAGQRAAVFRYNHSQEYVDTVLAIAEAYRNGDLSSGPVTYRADEPDIPSVSTPETPHNPPRPDGTDRQNRPGQHSPDPQPKPPSKPGSSDPDPSTPPTDPATNPATARQLATICRGQISAQFPQASDDAIAEATGLCVKELTGLTQKAATARAPGLVAGLGETVDGLIPPIDSICDSEIGKQFPEATQDAATAAVAACVEELTGMTEDEAVEEAPTFVAGLPETIDGLVPEPSTSPSPSPSP